MINAKKQLVAGLIKSLTDDYSLWVFDNYVATNKVTGVAIWIANCPILDLQVHRPTKVNFSLIDKFRIYRALDKCRSLYILSFLTPISK